MSLNYVLDKFDRLVSAASRGSGIIGALWIVSLMIVVTCDVIGRALFNLPVVGTPEIVRNSVPGIVFLLIPYAMRTNSHVRSSIILSRVPNILRRALLALGYLLGFIMFGLILSAAWQPMIRSWRIREFEGLGALEVPVYPIRTIIVAASLLMCLECLSSLLRGIREKNQSTPGGSI
jgi:TRAP-type C4-dicarboxylate transport system permease small subunit